MSNKIINKHIAELALHYFNCATIEINYKEQVGGFSNAINLIINHCNKRYLLRIFADSESSQKITNEITISCHAGKIKLSPKVLYIGINKRFILLEYIIGQTLNEKTLKSKSIQLQIEEIFQSLHNSTLSINYYAEDLLSQTIRLLQKLNNHSEWMDYLNKNGELNKWKCFLDLENKKPSCLIHNDPNPLNYLLDHQNKLWLIDWTDAGYGQIYSDTSMIELFLPDKVYENKNLHSYCTLRILRLLGWSLAQAQLHSPTSIIEPTIIEKKITPSPISNILFNIINDSSTLANEHDFLPLAPVFYYHYQRGLCS